MSATADRIVDDYLARLDAALAGVSGGRRHEIVEDVAEHIEAARTEIHGDDEAALRTLLDRIGEPEQIAADARDDQGEAHGRGRLETVAIVLLLAGGFLGGVGWLVGVVLLWLSNRWRVRDKVVGTLFVPGGLALPLVLLGIGGAEVSPSGEACTGNALTSTVAGAVKAADHCTHYGGTPAWHVVAGVVLLVALTAAAIAAAVHLARRSR